MAQNPILISGAGLASLLLGQSLKNSNIPFQIFERDASLSFRGQGYRLRLSNEGLDAIQTVLSPEKWERFWSKCSKTGGSGFAHLDAISGDVIEAQVSNEDLSSRDGKIVGVARGEMRKQFIEGIEEHVHFSAHVTGYELVEGGVRAKFADGSMSGIGSMLIGGDGVKSGIAKQVSGGQIKVYDTGARGIHGRAPTTAFKNLGEGVFRIATRDRNVGIITNVRPEEMDDPNAEFGWTMVGPPGVVKAPNNDYAIVGKQAAAIARALTKDWNEKFMPLFDEMNEDEAAFWKITCSRPSGVPQWENNPRVTVIGDAAHAMTPASGNGANIALRDSALLGRLIREAGGYKEGVTKEYEAVMRVYGSEAVALSYGLASHMMGVKIDEETTATV